MQLAASAVVLSSAGRRAAAQAALNFQVREYIARVEGFIRRVGRGPPLSAYSHGERETHRLLRALLRSQRRLEATYRFEHKLDVFESDDEADADDERPAVRQIGAPKGKGKGGEEPDVVEDKGNEEDEGDAGEQ
ncbi:MAG: hypothetical protein M1826_005491 [Phylliscum demangeonii]|nr:MAG: hypothetical protein M1826_005491 [Phylliscum demangeonii]